MYRGRPFRLVTIRLDDPEKQAGAIRVLKENHVAAANYILKTGDHDAFAEALDKEWPGPLHAGDRSGRKSRLPQGRSDRSAGSEVGIRQPPGTNLLSGASVPELALLAAF
jgi:hypothetical protein